ncbi:site-specific integrase [Kineococcus sp. NPDC059986]|uniref:tyrosine-type recombinase/integrase n=1 Tax=Kineococcus sp. NPDC059986 TaxID=3155538 RepID=UPI00344C5C10
MGDAPSTVNKHRYHLAGFFKWARAHEYMPPASDPLGTTRAMKIMPARKLRIPAQDFPALLDAAEHPKDRIIVALGLYLFLRGSEIAALRWSDYDMKNHEMHVKIEKTSQRDIMPVSEELDEELRIWALWYQNQQSGIFRQDWFIVPATVTHTGHEPVLVPSRPHPQGYRNVQRVLRAAGYAEEDGDLAGEGQHTLRRSGARALFDVRVEDGYDGALRQVQAMLHHTTGAMTEKYLGLDIDKNSRNKAIAGKAMFAKNLPTKEKARMKHMHLVKDQMVGGIEVPLPGVQAR